MLSIEIDQEANISVIGEADIHNAEALYAGLAGATAGITDTCSMNLGQLEALDTAGVQVLLAFKRQVPQLRVHSCPPRIRKWLDQLGLAERIL